MATVNKDFIARNGVQGTILKSTISTGTAPLQVASTTAVTNLNADLLDGNHASAFGLLSGNLGQFAATTSSQLAGVISDETGTGSLVFANTPTLVTPVLGVATATSINKVAITAPATAATLTLANNSTLATSGAFSVTLTATNTTTLTLPTTGTLATTSNNLGAFASTTSAQLAGVISDETGSGALVFGTSPSITTSLVTGSTSFDLLNTTATTINFGGAATTINVGNASGTVVIAGNLTVNGTTNTINSTTITVDDKNIELGSVTSPTDITADGGGITLKGATDKTLNWVDATDSWTSNQDFDLTSGKVYRIAGTTVLTNNGVNFTNSDLSSKAVTVSANSTPTNLDSFPVATYTTARYTLQMKQGTKMTTTEVMVVWDGTDVQVSEFGVVDATAGAVNATVTATHSAPNVNVTVSSPDAATTNVVCKALVQYIDA